MPAAAIEFRNVTKTFARGSGRRMLAFDVLRQLAGSWRNPGAGEFHALRDVSFTVEAGRSLGLVGHNGAGKSTLLSLATRVAEPDAGEVIVRGRLSSVLDLGAGFHPDLSGYENLKLNAALIGFTRERIQELTPNIAAFSGLESALADPVRTYSSGMVMRLAFAVAVELDPEVIVIDEMIAVGDDDFQRKCLSRMHEFRERGKTILLASHSMPTIRGFCDHALWLDHGRVRMTGTADEIATAYAGG